MPSSHSGQINEIMRLVTLCHPMSVLDIGVGFGKYGFLCREFLELWDGREKYSEWNHRIEGIEAFPEYISEFHSLIYDKIHIGEASKILKELDNQFDLILMIDVLEHFAEADGMEVLKLCLKKARNVIISTPKDIGVQEDAFDNPYETHRFQWEPHHLRQFGRHFVVCNSESLIAILGPDSGRVGTSYSRWRRGSFLGANFPRTWKLYRNARRFVSNKLRKSVKNGVTAGENAAH